MKKLCLNCTKEFSGRSDKLFCSTTCKGQYNFQRRKGTKNAVKEIDGYLQRNHEILSLLMGKSVKETFDRLVLTRTGFYYDHCTGVYFNREGKMYRYIYDFAWMEFSDQKILVVRKTK